MTWKLECLEYRKLCCADYPFASAAIADDVAAEVWRADLDGDGSVGFSDLLTLASFGRPAETADADALAVAAAFGKSLPLVGDLDLDARVGFADFLLLNLNFGTTDATWTRGDMDGDQQVGFSDFLALAANFGAVCPAAITDTPVRPDASQAIFAAGREYEYDATYVSAEGQLLSHASVTIAGTGNSWAVDQRQAEIEVRYEYTQEHRDAFLPHPLNPNFDRGWRSKTTTGAIESNAQVWMHPIRRNQYISTEVAPFPEVRLPLEAGKSWTSTLEIPERAWGDWGGTTVESQYVVASQEVRSYAFAPSGLEVWRVDASSSFAFGDSAATFYFHVDYGFVEMHYTNYADETLGFVMVNASPP